MSVLKVIIIGAGLGGLILAQSLRQASINVQVYERDKSPWDRPQGYRLHLDADALNAVREVLPENLQALFQATAYRTEPYTTILGTDLAVIKRLFTHDDHADAWPPEAEGAPPHANVDRATLRQILLIGLGDVVRYDKTLDRYETTDEGVTAYFSDGSAAQGDVLVGADGIRSKVRAQRAPHAQTVDAGVTAIYGRAPLQAAEALVPAETLSDIFTVVVDERKVSLGLGTVRFPTPPDQATARLIPGATMRPQDDYVVCVLCARPELFSSNKEALRAASSAELQVIAGETIKGWPERAATLIRAGDPSAFFLVDMFTSVPCALDAPDRVSLLGDAIHAMTPTLGRGANVAMRDGTLLGRALKRVARGEAPLAKALTAYERDMLDYGFVVVREAAEIGRQRIGQHPLP